MPGQFVFVDYNEYHFIDYIGMWYDGCFDIVGKFQELWMLSEFCCVCWGYVWTNSAHTLLHSLLGQPYHDDIIEWKHFPRYWPFVRGIHRSTVNSPRKGRWRGGLMFCLTGIWILDWVNNREAGDSRRHGSHYDIVVMWLRISANEANLKRMFIYIFISHQNYINAYHDKMNHDKMNNTKQNSVHSWCHNKGRKSGFQIGVISIDTLNIIHFQVYIESDCKLLVLWIYIYIPPGIHQNKGWYWCYSKIKQRYTTWRHCLQISW